LGQKGGESLQIRVACFLGGEGGKSADEVSLVKDPIFLKQVPEDELPFQAAYPAWRQCQFFDGDCGGQCVGDTLDSIMLGRPQQHYYSC